MQSATLQPAPAITPADLNRIRMAVENGPMAGASADSSKAVTLIGSRRDCDLSLPHADISQVHCAIINDGFHLECVDLSSRTGVFLNDRRVMSAPLVHNDTLRLGPVTITVAFAGDSVGSPTALSQRCPVTLYSTDRRWTLEAIPAVIGRRQSCPVVIDTPDVSLAHALLFWLGGTLSLMDLGSRSGTYVNGRRVTLVPVQDGDQIWIGGERLRVAARPSASAPPPVVAEQAAAAGEPDAALRVASGLQPPAATVPAPAPPGPRAIEEITVQHAEHAAEAGSLERSADHLVSELRNTLRRVARRERELSALAKQLDQQKIQQAVLQTALEAREKELLAREQTAGCNAGVGASGCAARGAVRQEQQQCAAFVPPRLTWFAAPAQSPPAS